MRVLMVVACWMMLSAPVVLAAERVLEWRIQGDFERTYKGIHDALEGHRFFVVFEPDIQGNLARFAERWGDDYNRNELDGIKAMVFCNAWYANQVSNDDPGMLALCPLHVTLVHKDGETRVLFLNPASVAEGTGAAGIAEELMREVSSAIEAGIAGLGGP